MFTLKKVLSIKRREENWDFSSRKKAWRMTLYSIRIYIIPRKGSLGSLLRLRVWLLFLTPLLVDDLISTLLLAWRNSTTEGLSDSLLLYNWWKNMFFELLFEEFDKNPASRRGSEEGWDRYLSWKIVRGWNRIWSGSQVCSNFPLWKILMWTWFHWTIRKIVLGTITIYGKHLVWKSDWKNNTRDGIGIKK